MKTDSVKTVHTFIETVDRDAWYDMFVAAPEEYANNSNLSYTRFGTSIGIADQSIPIAEFNRVMGMGIEEPINEESLDKAIAWMHQHAHADADFSFQIAPTAAPDSFEDLLDRKGLEKNGLGWAKFYRDGSPAELHPLPTSLDVRIVGAHNAEDFSKTVQTGFGVPESFVTFMSALAGRPNWKVYAAYDGDVPVASGAMYIKDGWAWLGCAATLPEYRGRGAQYALIHQRLTDGISAGVIGFTAETGQPAEGMESTNKSYCNLQRAGFKRMYVRPNYLVKKN